VAGAETAQERPFIAGAEATPKPTRDTMWLNQIIKLQQITKKRKEKKFGKMPLNDKR